MSEILTPTDLDQLRSHGISEAEAGRQLEMLRDPPPPRRLDRACRLDDGIRTLSPADVEYARHSCLEAAGAGRVSKFVPASGAATRMFAAIEAILESGRVSLGELLQDASGEILEIVRDFDQLPMADEVRARLTPGDAGVVESLFAMVDPQGLDFANRAKGLIPFHGYPEGSRTAFEEHLIEGARFAADASGRSRFHFTVPADQESAFRNLLGQTRNTGCEVTFSNQSPSTDTLAIDPEGRPARTSDGRLLLRPGGHGSLLSNLEATAADFVLVKNIDNIVPESRQAVPVQWQQALVGLLARSQALAFDILEKLDAGIEALAEAESFCREQLLLEIPSMDEEHRRQWVSTALSRPFRVCGMVLNQGEPGGGPFWTVLDDGAPTPQIVESAEVDMTDPSQREVWRSSTHFNPALLAVGLRDRHGRPHRLADFVDPTAVFVTSKSVAGQDLRVLEHPGLWNGSMAHWNTIFVEVSIEAFAPVKTLADLLRPEHQQSSP